jgi:EmrB/QacA subfamily drug resistance transporter
MDKQEAEYKNKGLVLLSIVILTFMACLDSSIVNVALPVMAKDFSIGMNSIAIIISIYLITVSATILIFGRLGDIKGKITIFKLGSIIFTIGSLLCAISNSLYFLVLSRIVQAIGASAFMATNQGIITRIFPANKRGKALGISGSAVALGTLAGPPLGGFIVDIASWQYIFLINIPFGILAFILGMRNLPENEKGTKAKFDVMGSTIYLIFIISLFGALLTGEKIGFAKLPILGTFAAAIIGFIIFIRVETSVESPLLELSIFRNKLFSLSLFCAFLLFLSMNCSNLILPFYFQDVLKMSPSMTGFYLMVYPLLMLIVAPVSGHISDKMGSEIITILGLVIYSSGCYLMATLNQSFTPVRLVIYILIMSLGNGMFQSPNNSLIMSSVPANRLGIAGSINALVRNIGLVMGVSTATILLYGVMSSRLGYTVTTFVQGKEGEFCYAMSVTYLAIGSLSLFGALLTLIRLYKIKKGAYAK